MQKAYYFIIKELKDSEGFRRNILGRLTVETLQDDRDKKTLEELPVIRVMQNNKTDLKP